MMNFQELADQQAAAEKIQATMRGNSTRSKIAEWKARQQHEDQQTITLPEAFTTLRFLEIELDPNYVQIVWETLAGAAGAANLMNFVKVCNTAADSGMHPPPVRHVAVAVAAAPPAEQPQAAFIFNDPLAKKTTVRAATTSAPVVEHIDPEKEAYRDMISGMDYNDAYEICVEEGLHASRGAGVAELRQILLARFKVIDGPEELNLTPEENAKIAKIQAFQRGKRARKEKLEQVEAARQIQSIMRGKHDRRQVVVMRAEAFLREELRHMKLRELKKRAVEDGVSDVDLDDAEDADDYQGAIISLIVVKEHERVATAEAERQRRMDEMRETKQAQIKVQAEHQRMIEDTRRQLQIKAQTQRDAHALAVAEREKHKGDLLFGLTEMKLRALKQKAKDSGVTEEQLDDAEDAHDYHAAVVQLVMSKEMAKLLPPPPPPPPVEMMAASHPMAGGRDELMAALARTNSGSLRHAGTVEKTGGDADALMFALSSGKASSGLRQRAETIERTGLVQADPQAEKMAQLLDDVENGNLDETEMVAKLQEMMAVQQPQGGRPPPPPAPPPPPPPSAPGSAPRGKMQAYMVGGRGELLAAISGGPDLRHADTVDKGGASDMDSLMYALSSGKAAGNLKHTETVEKTGSDANALMYALGSGKASSGLRHRAETMERTGLVQADPQAEKMARLLEQRDAGDLSEAELMAKLQAMMSGQAGPPPASPAPPPPPPGGRSMPPPPPGAAGRDDLLSALAAGGAGNLKHTDTVEKGGASEMDALMFALGSSKAAGTLKHTETVF